MSFNPGENVGPYRIIHQIGQGGMATVLKAYHAALDRHVAMKVLHPAFKEDPQFLQRFHREAKVVAKLEHSNIIPIHDFAEHKGQPYLVMKFIEGETLKARLARGPLSVLETKDIVHAVGSALNYAHDRGVLHRDVKPSNILLSEKGQIYLADFGLARLMGQPGITRTGIFLGTPDYASPEQAEREELDERSDIYSLGLVIYEMSTGQRPFTAKTSSEILRMHRTARPPSPESVNRAVPRGLSKVILRCLEKKPSARFANAAELQTALEDQVPR